MNSLALVTFALVGAAPVAQAEKSYQVDCEIVVAPQDVDSSRPRIVFRQSGTFVAGYRGMLANGADNASVAVKGRPGETIAHPGSRGGIKFLAWEKERVRVEAFFGASWVEKNESNETAVVGGSFRGNLFVPIGTEQQKVLWSSNGRVCGMRMSIREVK